VRAGERTGGGREKVQLEVAAGSWPMMYISNVRDTNDELMSEAEDMTERSRDMMGSYSQRKRLPRRILLQKSYTRSGLYVQKNEQSQHPACKCLVAHTQ
jgi:hypothetical protein